MRTGSLARLVALVAIAVALSAGLGCGGTATLAPFSQTPAPPSGTSAPPPLPPPTASGDTVNITVTSPSNGAIVSSPVRFLAWGRNGIAVMHLYVDDKQVYSSNNSQIDSTQELAAGNHSIVVQGWDTAGAVHKSSLGITVIAVGSPPPPPSSLGRLHRHHLHHLRLRHYHRRAGPAGTWYWSRKRTTASTASWMPTSCPI